MSEPDKRRFWQISLLTLLLTTFVTAALLALNTRIVSQQYYIPGTIYYDKNEAREYLSGMPNSAMLQESYRGWPFVFWKDTIWVTGQDFKPLPESITKTLRYDQSLYIFNRKLYSVVDFVIVAFIITLTAAACEYMIRRCEGRKPYERI